MKRMLSIWTIALGTHVLVFPIALHADDAAPGVMRPSAEDARDLAALAPPSRRATADVSYGDARLVRPRNRRVSAKALGADAPVGLYYCPDRNGRPTRELCARDPARVGFRDAYLYAPSYATSPQVRRDGRDREPSLLPPATALFYSANDLLFGNPPGE